MSGSYKVQAYLSFYEQGMTAYNNKDYAKARELLLRSAEIANDIAQNAITYSLRSEYSEVAKKLLDFVRNNCSVVAVEQPSQPCEQFVDKSEKSIRFSDVAGLDEVKEQVQLKVIEPLRNAELAKAYKIECGGRILLYGPPGTGKTFVARAIAGEVDARFFAVDCSDLISKYMGDSSKQLSALFNNAQKHERAIIFFDEIDSITAKRGDDGGVDSEMARFVSTFLTRIDGFTSNKNQMLLLIAATNRPWAIDSAMLRGGRFDTQIYVGTPDESARLFLIEKTFSGIPVDASVSFDEVGSALNGYGGGDIVAICKKVIQKGYKRALNSGKIESITRQDFLEVVSNQRNVITEQMIGQFNDYRKGLL